MKNLLSVPEYRLLKTGVPAYLGMVKKGNDERLGTVLQRMLETYRLKDKTHEYRLREHWQELFGAAVHKYTRSISVRNGRLYLELDSAPLRHELSFHTATLIERINDFTEPGFIREIVFK